MTPEELGALLQALPEPLTVSYRLYYNELGEPILYSMEELDGNYIEVDPATYAQAPFNVQVVDRQLVYIKPRLNIKKLQPSLTGVACHVDDICVVVSNDQAHIKWSLNE
jgi:hypothetical protein